MMLNTPCPYCQHPEMPAPPSSPRPFAACPSCGLRARAKLTVQNGGPSIVTYSAVGRRHCVATKDTSNNARYNNERFSRLGISFQSLVDWAIDNYPGTR